MKLTREEMVAGLVERHGYTQVGAVVVAARLLSLQPQLQEEFERWWDTGAIPTLDVEGFTADRLMREQDLKPIAAILTLDWLIREPEKAKAAILQGYDRVSSK